MARVARVARAAWRRGRTAVPGPLRRLWGDYLAWPVPLWRLRGRARLRLGGHAVEVRIGPATLGWARRARRGTWEAPVLAFFAGALRPGDVVLDVGAWVGPYTLLAARRVGPAGRVYAFEPDPVARGLLARHVAANRAGNVTVVPAAVADRDGAAWLAAPGPLGRGETALAPRRGAVRVPTVTLATFCAARRLRPAVVKIDVEGGEAQVFAGAGAALDAARAVVLEVHAPLLRRRGVDPDAFVRSLFGHAARVVVLDRVAGTGPPPGAALRPGDALTGYAHLALLPGPA